MLNLVSIDCPYCGANEAKQWASEDGYTAVKCTRCAFVYVNPRPSAESIKESVHLGVHQTGSGTLSVVGGFRKSKQRKKG